MSEPTPQRRQFITYQLMAVPAGIDSKVVVRLGGILGIEPVSDNFNVSLLRVSYPVFDAEGHPLPGYLVKGSVSANYKRLSEAIGESELAETKHIDIA